jgi:hypothetical protein
MAVNIPRSLLRPAHATFAPGEPDMPIRKNPRSPISKPGEKAVRRSSRQEVPIKPPKRSREATEPLPLPAVDQRDQISGTDELKARRQRRRGR